MSEVSGIYQQGSVDPDPNGDGIRPPPKKRGRKARDEAPDVGHNGSGSDDETVVVIADTAETRVELRNLVERWRHTEAQRAEISDERKAIRSRAKSLGCNPRAFERAVKLEDMDAEKREDFDRSLAWMRRVIGIPDSAVQVGLDLGGGSATH